MSSESTNRSESKRRRVTACECDGTDPDCGVQIGCGICGTLFSCARTYAKHICGGRKVVTDGAKPSPGERDLVLAFVVGPWGGFHLRRWHGLRMWSLNFGFVGVRGWRGDLPYKVATEGVALANAAKERGINV